MRKTILALLLSLPAAFAADLAGTWKMTAQSPNGDLPFRLVFERQGDGYKGEARGGSNAFPLEKITAEGNKVNFTIMHEIGPIPVELTLTGNQLDGAGTLPDGTGKIPMKGSKEEAAAAAAAVSAAGRWKIAAKSPDGGVVNYALDVKEEGSSLSGTAYNPDGEGAPMTEVKLTGSVFTFKVPTGDGAFDVTMTIEGDSAKGSYKTPDGMKGEFTATRAK
jgi:hypothetical protein